MRVLDKAAALVALEAERQRLPPGIGCVACALIADPQRGARCIAESRHGALVVNRFAARERHLLVIAKRHVEHIHEMPADVYGDLQQLAHRAACMLTAHRKPARIYTAVFGSATPLPMSYPHLHVHVVPIMDADAACRPTQVFGWTEGVVLYDEPDALALTRELRDVL